MSLDAAALDSPVIGSFSQLIDWMRVGEKPASEHRCGLETEKLAVALPGGEPAPLQGPRSLSALMRRIAEETGGRLLEESGAPIGVLLEGGASVAFEPGGQLELSGAPYRRLAAMAQELREHLALVRRLADEQGLLFVATAYRPTGPRASVQWLPRGRYALMRGALPGRRAHDMMQMTASVQANFDFADEADLAAKVAAATAVSPLVAAMFAHAPLVDGRPTGLLSERGALWSEVDPRRCGLVRQMYEPGFSYETYLRWVVSVPLLFVRRGGRYVNPEGRTFADLMREGMDGQPATLMDFADALSTLFPEVRVKRVIEVRSADAVDERQTMALPALWTGLLYDAEACRGARRLVDGPFEALVALGAAVPREGLRARWGGVTVQELCRELLQLAEDGLRRRHVAGHDDERPFLEPLHEVVASGLTPAERTLARWSAARDEAARLESLRL